MYQNFDDEKKEKASRNPFNRNILKGGQVDPGSKMYQRSVAGREKLDTMLQRLWSDGMDEADVFMAGVKALTSRDKGYVGAYLDAKNPGRIYQKNEAMAITDQVMKDTGIGSHPGNRLTREKDEEGKAKRKEENISRGGFGPKQASGAKAMPVRQQRKQGKRLSTGQPVEETDREGIADRETGPRSEWQNTLRDRMEGKATTADVLEEFQKQYQSKLSQSPQAQAKRDEKTGERQQKMRDQIAEQKDLRDQEAAAGPETEEASLTAEQISEIENRDYGFRANINDFYNKREDKSEEGLTPEIIDKAVNQVATDLDVDPALVSDYVARKYSSLTERAGWTPQKSAATPEQPSAAPTETAAAPEPAEGAAPETEETPAPAPEPEAPAAGPSEEEAPTPRIVTSKGGFKAPPQQGRKKGGGEGFGGARAAAPEIMKAGKEAPSLEDFKTYLYNTQGELFGKKGFETEGSDNPLEGGSAATPEQPSAPERGGQEPPEAEKAGAAGQQSMFKKGTLQPRTGKGFGSNVDKAAQPTSEKANQRSIRGLGPSAGKFDTTRTQKAGDELLTQNLKSYGFTPKQVKEIQKSGLTEQERQQITSRRDKEQEVKESQRKAPEPAEQPGLLDEEGRAQDFTKSGPERKPSPPSGGTQRKPPSKGKSPLDQVAKAVLSGLERDKAARESAGQFFNRVRDLIQKQAGQGASKSDVDQAAAKAINQQKGRTTRNKARKNTVDSAEYQEFAQSIRSMIR